MLSRNKTLVQWSLVATAALLGAAATGCEKQGPGTDGAGGFVSDSPFGSSGQNGDGSATGAGGGDEAADPGSDNGGDAEKAIQEADVIQVDGDRLFTLSQYGGLSVVDMTDPAHLALVGHHDIQGVPFEMYLRDGVVYAMFSSFGRWECDEDYYSCEYITSSHIEALDVTNPASIASIGSFDLPGEISDSRIVGDVLYAVSYESGYCWNCGDSPTTTVTSIDVADPSDIGVVDAVSFDSPDPYGYGWSRRSVTVTPDRMFIAGIEWDGTSQGHSTIQVVDISDPGGVLHVGAAVAAKGMIESRWQMDELGGVLRVISQPGIWDNGVPTVQTFQVASSDSVTPIASLDLTLPKPERLRSARFDGTRLYAITAEQTDPLFTIDVSDPAAPAQVGQLEIPGWVYHLEPRGDRVFALGFDNANPGGSMNVSLFDVSNFAAPALVERVAFGGDWSWAPEDQDRIHKAFKIDQDLGAILVPYGAYEYDENQGYYGCGHIESGIQIIDFTQDSLTKRGAAPLHGFARRALVHAGKLFSVSDSEVGAYDITNRDAPAQLDSLALSSYVNQSVRVGDKVVRVAADWWTSAAALDVVSASTPDAREPLGKLDLAEVVGPDGANDCYGWGYFYGAQLFAMGQSRVAIAWSTYDWYGYEDAGGPAGGAGAGTHVVVVNIADPTAPVVEGRISMPFSTDMYGWWGSLDGGKAVVQMGTRLVFRRVVHPAWDSNDLEQAWLEVVDLTNAAQPVHSASLQLPDGFGHSLLVKNGLQLLTSHWEPLPGNAAKVRFYLDRVAFPPVGVPAAVASMNVPGALLSFDEASSHALTIDFQRKSVAVATPEDCWQTYGWNTSVSDANGMPVCTYVEQTLKLIALDGEDVEVLDSEALDPTLSVYSTQVTESRVFAQGYSYDGTNDYGSYSVLVIGDVGDDVIHTATQDLPAQDYLWPVASEGDHLVLASWSTPGIHVLDATDMGDLSIEKKGDVMSYVYSVTLDGDSALCAMGPYGLDVVDLQ